MSTQLTYDATIFPPAAPSELVVVPLERVLGEVRPLVERVAERKRVAVMFDTAAHLPTAARNELPLMRLCYLLIAGAPGRRANQGSPAAHSIPPTRWSRNGPSL